MIILEGLGEALHCLYQEKAGLCFTHAEHIVQSLLIGTDYMNVKEIKTRCCMPESLPQLFSDIQLYILYTL